MIDKNKVIDILKKYPKGLKAKDIADFIVGADRKAINQVLYSNPTLFSCNSNYEWTLISKTTIEQKTTPTNNISQEKNSYIDREIFNEYRNYYVKIKQYIGKDKVLKLYLVDDNDYIIQSNTHDLNCPFCNHTFSIHSFDCPRCGHTMHEICEKLYSEWNIDGNRFYITWGAVDEYPVQERKRKVYEAVRSFVISSIPSTVCNYFKKTLDEVHLSTLVMIYQKSLGIEKVEDDIKDEVERGKKSVFKHATR